jgi:chemosensory pili system protein ChpA (sensor histidine kinase/response regulator)
MPGRARQRRRRPQRAGLGARRTASLAGNAHKALRRYLKEAEARGSDLDAVDPAVLRSARTQLHQGVGALELVGLPADGRRAARQRGAVQRMVAQAGAASRRGGETIERVSFALLDFLGRQLAGKPVSPVMLFPQYRAVQQLAGADRVHPADLWKDRLAVAELPPTPTAQPRAGRRRCRAQAMESWCWR